MHESRFRAALALTAIAGVALLWLALGRPDGGLAGQQVAWLQGGLGAALLASLAVAPMRAAALGAAALAKASLLFACLAAGRWDAAAFEAGLLAMLAVAAALLVAHARRERAWDRGLALVEP